MTSRFSAARPSCAGEAFARSHHAQPQDPTEASTTNPKFDIRNPSALAPDAAEEDAVLEADVIGGGGAGTKRGAVNLDGYDSDSENEGFDGRAAKRGKGNEKVDLGEVMDGYDKGSDVGMKGSREEEEEDMFADLEPNDGDEDEEDPKLGKKDKDVRFLEVNEIEGQVSSSKSGGHISGTFALDPNGRLSTHAMDDQESSDDSEEAALLAQEEDVDEEVGAGGLKRNAPKVDAFNMKAEQEEGRFDEAGNFVRKARDRDAVHDGWLEGVSKKDVKKAKEAHEKREEERRKKIAEDDEVLVEDVLRTLILGLERGESVLEALARLGRGQAKVKKVPKWKLKKQRNGGGDAMEVDEKATEEDPEQRRIREAVERITGAADQLLSRGQTDVYDLEREMLIRQYSKEAGEPWVEPAAEELDAVERPVQKKMWEYRWTDGRDGGVKQGAFDGETMVAWREGGYFGEGVEFKRSDIEDGEGWSRVVDFL